MQTGRRVGREADVVSMCADLIRFNTSNPTHPEAEAARYVASVLAGCGLECEWFEPAPGRVSLVARWSGQEPDLPPLLVHAHLDTVPAAPEDWSRDPFAGDIVDGCVWGRGAVDMKGMVAATLAVVENFSRTGRRPRRDVILAFFADEESGGLLGASHVVGTRPDLFAGCRVAIGEVGGFSRSLGGRRAYFIAAAEKGVLWARLTAKGTAGHGSMLNDSNPIVSLAHAISRISTHRFPNDPCVTTQSFLDFVAGLLGVSADSPHALIDKLGPMSRMLEAGLRDTFNPTTLEAGYKVNVVPGMATATVDGRFLPGHGQQFAETLESLAGDGVAVERVFAGDALESPWADPLVDAISAALVREDPTAVAVPYMSTAFTDAKWLTGLGIRCYGFCPMLMPDDLDFTALFHGADERVPVDSLTFCVSVLENLLEIY